MGLKTFTIAPHILATSKHCRLDQKYAAFTHVDDWVVFNSKYEQVKLSELLEEIPIIKYKKGELQDEYFLVNISDQQQRSGDLENIEITDEIGSDKNYLGDADIFISKLGMPRGYIFLNTYKNQNVLGSTELIPYKVKNERIKTLIKYLLLHPKSLRAYSYLESGKTPSHRRVNPYEFLKIKIPLIPESIQDQIVAKIEPIEKNIKELKAQITPPQEIINKVFAREFEFDLERFEELKKEMFFKVDLKNFANHSDLRFSVSDFRNYLIFKGSSKIIPQDKFSEISIKDISIKHKCTNLKKGELDKANLLVELENVGNHNGKIFDIKEVEEIGSDKLLFADADILTTKLRPYLGKTILNNFDEEAIGTTEWIPLKIDQTKIIKEYLFYILLSNLYTEKAILLMSGKNHPRIKPEILFDFKIPNIDLSTQQKIVDEIKAEFDKQEEIKKNIEAERNKIDEIVEKAIK